MAHACGHDVHVACLVGAAQLFASAPDQWAGTLVALFQPAEETGDGTRRMLDDGLARIIPTPDVALAQHVLPAPAGWLGTRAGPVFSAADSMRITVHGRGGHGSKPQVTVDPVVLAAMIVIRLQTILSRETPPGRTAVLTVGSIQAGSTSNVIPDHAVLQLNIRIYDEQTRGKILEAIPRVVLGECQASGCPKDPEFDAAGERPQREGDVTSVERAGRHLVQQGLERRVGIAVEQQHVGVGASQRTDRGQAGEPSSHHDNARARRTRLRVSSHHASSSPRDLCYLAGTCANRPAPSGRGSRVTITSHASPLPSASLSSSLPESMSSSVSDSLPGSSMSRARRRWAALAIA